MAGRIVTRGSERGGSMHFGATLSGFLIRAPPPSSSVAFHTTSSSVPRSPHLPVACMVPTSEGHCAAHLLLSKEAPQPLTVSPDWGVHRRGRAGLLGAFVLPGVSGSHSKAIQRAWRDRRASLTCLAPQLAWRQAGSSWGCAPEHSEGASPAWPTWAGQMP